MLSRIRPRKQIREVGVIDTEDWVDPQAFPDSKVEELLPLLHDGLNLLEVATQQREEFPELW